MAESNVERRSPGVWLWVVGLLVLALLVWALTELFMNDSAPVVPEGSDTLSSPANAPAPFPESAEPVPAATEDSVTGSDAIPDPRGATMDTPR